VAWLPSGDQEGCGTAIESTRSRHPKPGTPILSWCGAFIRCAAATHWLVEPNTAHVALAKVEQALGDRFYLCTQNVDDLHERGGSLRVHHMHGTLFASRCVDCGLPFPDQKFYEDANNLPHAKSAARRCARTSCGSAKSL